MAAAAIPRRTRGLRKTIRYNAWGECMKACIQLGKKTRKKQSNRSSTRSHAPRGNGYFGRSAAVGAERPNMHSAAERRNEDTEALPYRKIIAAAAVATVMTMLAVF